MRKVLFSVFFFTLHSAVGQQEAKLSASEKVFALSKFWQEVNYNFVYLNQVDRNQWDSTYLSLIGEVQRTENDYDYYRLLKRFCAILKDGHTNIEFPSRIKDQLMNTHFGEYRIIVKNIEHRAIITHVNASKKNIIPPGSEIIEVNSLAAKDYIARFVSPYISSSATHVLEDMATSEMFLGLRGASYSVKIKKPNGEVISLELTHTKTTEKELEPPLAPNPELLEFKWLENKTAYVALNSFQDERIDSMFIAQLPELRKAKSLIIDLRQNGGGNSEYAVEILQHLVSTNEIAGAKSRTRNHIATYKAWGEMVSAEDTMIDPDYMKAYLNYNDAYYYDFPYAPRTISPDIERIIVPTAVLIGHYTASSSEDFLIFTDEQSHFTKIGSPTFGSTGQPLFFTLLGEATAQICTKEDTYRDGRRFVGSGILPDIYCEQTVQDYLNGTDVVLNTALKFLREQSK